jgi:hypothetical protein
MRLPGARLGDEVSDLGCHPKTAEAIGEGLPGRLGIGGELGLRVDWLADPVEVGQRDELQRSSVDKSTDVSKRIEALALLVDRFASDEGQALAESQTVGQELECSIDEVLPLVKRPAGVTIDAKTMC